MFKVIIVEDEEIIRKGLVFMVDWLKVGCVVAGEAVDGVEGLQKIEAIRPDIVITDVKMPFKNGIEMLQESIERYGYEAIIISGYSEFEYAKQAITLNVTEYLLKPIDFVHLYQTIEKLTGKIESKNKVKKVMLSQESPPFENGMEGQLIRKGKSKYVSKMLDYIQIYYPQKISINDLSKQYGVSSTYLNAKFKQETNYTFNDFLNRYRVLQAVELLRQDKMKVYEIAEVVGFQDYKYFIQVFKKYVGCSPGRFVVGASGKTPF